MKLFIVFLSCFAISCADNVQKNSYSDPPDQGMDAAIDGDMNADMVSAPDLSHDLKDVPDLPDPNVDPIKITTWNILCLRENPEPVFCNTDTLGNEFVRSPQQVDALRQHALAIGTDLLFLQEVENLTAVENLLPGWDVFDVGNGGQNLAVAVSPGSSTEVLEVSTLQDLDIGSSVLRPGLVAQIKHADITVHILSVHLKSGCQIAPLATSDASCAALRDQLDVLEEWIKERESQNQPYMLVGDFNRVLENNDPFMQALDEAAGQPLTRTTLGARPDCWDHLPEAPSYPSFIDHHIASPALVAAWGTPTLNIYNYVETYPNAWMYVSDHCAITASFD